MQHHRTTQKIILTCQRCTTEFSVGAGRFRRGQARYCSNLCRTLASRIPLEQRFWAKVRQSDTCWTWTAGLSGSGYGQFWTRRGTHSEPAHRYALESRLGRPLKPGFLALHTCDHPPCVRNDGDEDTYEVNGVLRIRFGHLFEGTPLDNSRDMAIKGRSTTGDRNGTHRYPERLARGDRNGSKLHPETRARGDRNGSRMHPERLARGERHGNTIYTEAQVRDMRIRHAAEGMSFRALARDYGGNPSTIARIIHRKTWDHLS